ncbi:MAG: hypothetical protein N4P91_00895 [Candidatus Lightella neohaematopini]|nr:hypothetical protein [Candidatus Lightella neohaematopini]
MINLHMKNNFKRFTNYKLVKIFFIELIFLIYKKLLKVFIVKYG